MSKIDTYHLRNDHGLDVEILTLGGIVASLRVPDRQGTCENIVLGFADPDTYRTQRNYFGAIIGRCANRIAQARFCLDGVEYRLAANNGPHNLHSGPDGFDRRIWTVLASDSRSLSLTLDSPDGDQGFPGNLHAAVTYSIAADRNELSIAYAATCDRPTLVNMTAHSYFNLAGEGAGDVRAHLLSIDADAFTPIDAGLIPTGAVADVTGTSFDLRLAVPLGLRLESDDAQLRIAGGFDHNFVLRKSLGPAARLIDPGSGRVLDLWTSEPGLQLYTGNELDGSSTGRSGRAYARNAGLCLEPQHFPDAPHHPEFPSIRLDPGQTYRSMTRYAFTVTG
jgi:aldose 1-epimerase